MSEGNSHLPIENNNPETSVFVYNSQSPITRPPQNVSTNRGPLTLDHAQEDSYGLRNNFNSVINGLRPLMEQARNARANGHSFRSLFRRPSHSEQNTRNSNPSESFVINLENIPESSGSNVGQFYNRNPNRIISGQNRVQSISTELDGQNDRNSGIQMQENNIGNNNELVMENEQNHIQENSALTTRNSVQINNNGNNSNIIQNSEGVQTEILNSSSVVENQSIDKLLSKYIPFITFLLMIVVYDRREGILVFIGLLVTFIHANSVIKREIAKKNRRSLLSIGILFLNLSLCIFFIYFVFKEQQLYKNLIFIPPYLQPLSIWDLLWMVGVTDFILKFITIQLKLGMACFPEKLFPYSARGKWYLMLECTSQLYRSLVPIQPWLYYLNKAYGGTESTIGMVFSATYIISKGSEIRSKAKMFMKAFWKLLRNTNLGVRPTKEELENTGPQCPICHDDFNSPVALQCKHIFCEECVSTWFDREQSCPLCRAKVAGDPAWRDGSTSFFIQLF